MSEQQGLWRVAFLDTNTLHYIGLYLEHAKEKNLFPFGAESTKNRKDDAIEEVNSFAEVDLKRSLKRGLQTFDFLLTQDVQVQYAPVSEIELLNGRIRGKAIVSMAKEGVPERMWSRIGEKEVRERMSLEDMTETKQEIDRLLSLLDESGVVVKLYEIDRVRDVLELAKGVDGLVYMQAMDSIIYASAILARADFLITNDGYVRDTINLICGEDGERYAEVNKRLKDLVRQFTMETADDVVLPNAYLITADGSLEPQLPHSND